MSSESKARRSRFGDEPSEPPRRSKFDRRSRSPTDRNAPETRASRSPPPASSVNPAIEAAKAKARAAAARINAANADRKNQPPPPPPVRLTAPSTSDSNGEGGGSTLNKDIYTQDGDFIKDIEINDLKNRYVMTKGPTQKMIKEETGADVTTRGSYYPDKRMATATQPPLYLHVTSTTKEGLEKAVAKIEDLIAQALPDLVDQRRFRGRRDQDDVERDAQGRRKWPEERIPINLEPIPGFNLRAAVVGGGGAHVKHIQQESGCRIQIKGRGSGYLDGDTGRESDEDMYLHITSPDQSQIDAAKELSLSLLASVREKYEEFKEGGRNRNNGPRNYHGGNDNYGGRDRQPSGDQYGQAGNGYSEPNAYGMGGYGATQASDPNAYGMGGYDATQANNTNGYGMAGYDATQAIGDQNAGAFNNIDPVQVQAWTQYYAMNPAEDPYQAYGGYATYMAMYQQWAAGQSGSPAQGYDPNAAAAPPPPPPPPPPSGDASNGPPPPPPS